MLAADRFISIYRTITQKSTFINFHFELQNLGFLQFSTKYFSHFWKSKIKYLFMQKTVPNEFRWSVFSFLFNSDHHYFLWGRFKILRILPRKSKNELHHRWSTVTKTWMEVLRLTWYVKRTSRFCFRLTEWRRFLFF